MADHVLKTIQMVQEQIADLELQVAEKKKIINGLCSLVGQSPLYQDVEPKGTSSGSVRADQFYGRALATVVREILEMKGAAATVNEIFATMTLGGFEFNAKNEENAKRILRISLSKNTAVFHKLPNGTYGLLEWYPNVRSGRNEDTGPKKTVAPQEEHLDVDDGETGGADLFDELEEDVPSEMSAVPRKG